MARPPQADAARTQRRILDAAIAKFGEQGVKGSSLRAIAADAGVTFATVHHYFGNKAGLFDACLARSYTRLDAQRDELAKVLVRRGALTTKVRALAEKAFDLARAQLTVTRFLLRATLYEDVDRERGRAAQAQYLDVASRLLSPIVERPAESLRVPLQGFMFLLTRAAIVSESELDVVADTAHDERTVGALRSYVGDVAVATLIP